jgi:c-di-GMP-binding flagellar brake protein YcgR
MPDHPDDRRRHSRARVELQVEFRFASVQEFLSACAGDVSEGGMFLRVHSGPYRVGEGVYLRFHAGAERIVRGTARVVRVEEGGIAVEFVDLDETSRRLIEMIVRIQLAAG